MDNPVFSFVALPAPAHKAPLSDTKEQAPKLSCPSKPVFATQQAGGSVVKASFKPQSVLEKDSAMDCHQPLTDKKHPKCYCTKSGAPSPKHRKLSDKREEDSPSGSIALKLQIFPSFTTNYCHHWPSVSLARTFEFDGKDFNLLNGKTPPHSKLKVEEKKALQTLTKQESNGVKWVPAGFKPLPNASINIHTAQKNKETLPKVPRSVSKELFRDLKVETVLLKKNPFPSCNARQGTYRATEDDASLLVPIHSSQIDGVEIMELENLEPIRKSHQSETAPKLSHSTCPRTQITKLTEMEKVLRNVAEDLATLGRHKAGGQNTFAKQYSKLGRPKVKRLFQPRCSKNAKTSRPIMQHSKFQGEVNQDVSSILTHDNGHESMEIEMSSLIEPFPKGESLPSLASLAVDTGARKPQFALPPCDAPEISKDTFGKVQRDLMQTPYYEAPTTNHLDALCKEFVFLLSAGEEPYEQGAAD